MLASAMHSTFRQLLTYSLLATYASIALLGEGLHWLTPDEHHHGASLVVSSEADSSDTSSESHAPADKHVTATHGFADHHDCEICDFLAQAVSAPPVIAEVPAFDTLIVEAPLEHVTFDSPIVLGLHAPRGPPQLLG